MPERSHPRLEDLGSRICVMGPSNSGKSTLAAAIGTARSLAVVHLDVLFHRPETDWEQRPEQEFLALHEQAIAGERWVIDGNYTRCLPQRLERATGVIVLDVSTITSTSRYLRRTLFQRRQRIGGLIGGRDSLKWSMIRHIALGTPANRERYAAQCESLSQPKIGLLSRQAISAFYRREQLPFHSMRD